MLFIFFSCKCKMLQSMGVRDVLVCRGVSLTVVCAGGWRRESKLAKGDRSLWWAVFDGGAGLNATMIRPITKESRTE